MAEVSLQSVPDALHRAHGRDDDAETHKWELLPSTDMDYTSFGEGLQGFPQSQFVQFRKEYNSETGFKSVPPLQVVV